MTTVAEATTISYSGDRRADALMDSFANWNFLTPDITPAANTLYFTFALSAELSSSAPDHSPQSFNAAQQAAARAILAYCGQVTGIQFVESGTATSADLHFANADLSGSSTSGLASSSWSYNHDGVNLTSYSAEAYVFLDDVEWSANGRAPVAGNAGYETLLHEIGHALGLKHPFEGDFTLAASEDDTNHTVMSYQHAGVDKSEFQPYDLLALTWIYGGDGLGGQWGYHSVRGLSLNPVQTPPPLTLIGTAQADTLVGGLGPDKLSGLAGDDRLVGAGDDDQIDGGSGIDLSVHSGNRASHALVRADGAWTLQDLTGGEGTDLLVAVERLQFADSQLALDLDGHAGQVARIIGAVFGKAYLERADFVGIGLQLLDDGMAYADLIGLALSTELFAQMAGSRSDSAFVDTVYRNVVGVLPDVAEHSYFVGLLEQGQFTQTSLAQLACDSEVNALQVDLVGLASAGIDYTPGG